MGKKYYIIITVSVLLITSLGFSLDNRDVESVELDIENSLIIREIEMEEEPGKDDDKGFIITDDSFDDSLSNYQYSKAKVETHDNKRHVKKAVNELLLLQKNDSRWHITEYTIKKHDNIWSIAGDFNTDHKLIIRINNINNPDIIKPGKTLKIPNKNGRFHRIKKGESIFILSKKYGVSQKIIINHNRVNPRRLLVGERIFIPDAKETSSISTDKNHIALLKKKDIHSEKFSWPLRGRITSAFGKRSDPFTGKKAFHCGIDISAKSGTPIHASSSGIVIFSGWKNGYGNVVILRHKNNFITVYAHNSKNSVKEKDRVNKGQVIALSGNTGAVTGAHLHFEIRKYINPLNPMRFLN